MKKIFLLVCFVASVATARDIKLVVPYSPGGGSDQLARVLEPLLSNSDYNFIVEYRLGAGGEVAANLVAKTRDDTVIMVITPGLIGSPMVNRSSNYNVLQDFILVKYIGIEPMLVVVDKKTKITDFKTFVNEQKKHSLPYGSAGIGTSSHLAAAIIANHNTNLFNVPYKGSSAVITDLLANRVAWTVDSDLVLGPYIKNADLTPIAVYGRQRMSKYPGVPTLKELKINDQNFYRWHVLVANASADPVIINYLQERLRNPAVRTAVESLGIDATPVKNPENFFKNETVKLQRIIQDYSITQ